MAQQEAETVRKLTMTYEATQALKRKQQWLSHVVTGVASPMLVIDKRGVIRVSFSLLFNVCLTFVPRLDAFPLVL